MNKFKRMSKIGFLVSLCLLFPLLSVKAFESNSSTLKDNEENYTIVKLRQEFKNYFSSEKEIDEHFQDYPDTSRIIAEPIGGFTGVIADSDGIDSTLPYGDGSGINLHDSRTTTIGELKDALKKDLSQ